MRFRPLASLHPKYYLHTCMLNTQVKFKLNGRESMSIPTYVHLGY
jgi:hypothetical protein